MSQGQGGIPPHGGELVDRVLRGGEREAALERAEHLKKIDLNPVSVSDLELIAVGAFSPLTGFMGEADYGSVVEQMRLQSGLVWSLPITLPVSAEVAQRLGPDEEVALVEGDRVLGLMRVSERFAYDREREAERVYRTTDPAHPGVARLYAQGEVLLGGEVWLLNRPAGLAFPEFRHDPAQSRRLFAQRGWRRVVGFQTRNPVHRAHEYIQKAALEIVDGLFLHPLVGETKPDDIPAQVRMEAYQALLRDYYPPGRTVLGVFPAAMRYAGPREAIFHAIARKNYGCTHFIVGRDHAGVGSYYGTYDAQLIFDQFRPEELGVTPLFFEHTFYCRQCGGMASAKTCPHDRSFHVVLSGTQVREMLRRGEKPPPEFTRPEVAQILVNGVRGAAERQRRVMVIGLDCLAPQLVFDEWRDELPNLSRLIAEGAWGELESTVPPITVPAWTSMMTGKDPGQLGFYGFRNRANYSYDEMAIANSRMVKERTVWDVLSEVGKRVILIGVPQTYPPKPVNGHMITCFLTPSTSSQYTFPAELKAEVEGLVGDYPLDVENFRTEDKDNLLHQIYEMTEKHFKVARHLATTREWDFFMMVEMGPDRIHHGFWKYSDPAHPKYEPGNPYQNAIGDYYRFLDGRLGELLSTVGDETVVLVVSDHGAQKMDGGLCINEWLMAEGYLHLKEKPNGVIPLEKAEIDWGKTVAWGSGGYYGRLFLNVRGREPSGVIAPDRYEAVRDQLIERLVNLRDHQGRPMGTRVFKPQQVYQEVKGIPPDLIVYFGNLSWRSVGSVGLGRIHTFENDTGPDDANHAQQGVFIMYDPLKRRGRQLSGLHITDCAVTILNLMGVDIPPDLPGRVIS